MSKIEIKDLYLIFGHEKQKALKMLKKDKSKEEILKDTGCTVGVKDANLSINEGEFFVIMGLSGSGKSTLLRCINRLIRPTAGQVLVNGVDISKISEKELLQVRRKELAMVFQNFGLLPHRSVLSNIAFGLELQGVKKEEREKKEKPLPLFDKAGIKIKKKPDLVAKLDKVFSRYIRLRDCMPNGYFRCISCGQIKPYEQADCGHFHSRRHMATRFDEDNAHAECRACNRFSADHLIQYEKNLKAKIGQLRFDKLAWRASQAKKWTDFELIELTKYYKALGDKLSKEKGL